MSATRCIRCEQTFQPGDLVHEVREVTKVEHGQSNTDRTGALTHLLCPNRQAIEAAVQTFTQIFAGPNREVER